MKCEKKLQTIESHGIQFAIELRTVNCVLMLVHLHCPFIRIKLMGNLDECDKVVAIHPTVFILHDCIEATTCSLTSGCIG